jgi:hypothetical protein
VAFNVFRGAQVFVLTSLFSFEQERKNMQENSTPAINAVMKLEGFKRPSMEQVEKGQDSHLEQSLDHETLSAVDAIMRLEGFPREPQVNVTDEVEKHADDTQIADDETKKKNNAFLKDYWAQSILNSTMI